MNQKRRLFLQQLILLSASSSFFNFIKINDAWSSTPHKSLDKYFTLTHDICTKYLNSEVNSDDWRTKFNQLLEEYPKNLFTTHIHEYIDFKKIEQNFDFGKKGRSSKKVSTPLLSSKDLQKIDTKIIGVAKGHAIPPHCHRNMASASIIMKGNPEVIQSNLIKEDNQHLKLSSLKKTVQQPGQWSTMTRQKANIHWFKATDQNMFMLNVNIEGLLNKKAEPGIRISINEKPDSEGLLTAQFITNNEAESRYGKL